MIPQTDDLPNTLVNISSENDKNDFEVMTMNKIKKEIEKGVINLSEYEKLFDIGVSEDQIKQKMIEDKLDTKYFNFLISLRNNKFKNEETKIPNKQKLNEIKDPDAPPEVSLYALNNQSKEEEKYIDVYDLLIPFNTIIQCV